jgi:DNA-binding SARP family transcriptional activator
VVGQPSLIGQQPWTNSEPSSDSAIYLRILGRFELVVRSRPITVGTSGQRLLALTAMRGGQLNREQAAGLLWPDVTEARATANLRSVLWRLRRCCPEVVINRTFSDVWFASDVVTDLQGVQVTARRLLDLSSPLSRDELRQALNCNLYDDVLPGLGTVEWLEPEAERHRQLRLHALDALAEQLIEAGWLGAAVEAALGALRADPFRESACHLLVKAHLAGGNQLEAHRQYQRYCAALQAETGLQPSASLQRLVWNGARRADPRRASSGSLAAHH